jgi:transposase-like protein
LSAVRSRTRALFPPHLVADEKHSWWFNERVYIATTVAAGCFLGVGVSETADTAGLTQAYGEFQQEILSLNSGYEPETVNTDGWESTQKAWQQLFPNVTLMLCFLHTILSIQRSCRRNHQFFQDISKKLWDLYHSPTPGCFGQRLRRLMEWSSGQEISEVLQQKLQKLVEKSPQFKLTFAIPQAYRTSNQVDRLMNYQDRILYAMQYFHGTKESMRLGLRAMAMLWNFHPYGQKTLWRSADSLSPFEDLNGFRYHDNWLRNLLIASSLNGRGTGLHLEHKIS